MAYSLTPGPYRAAALLAVGRPVWRMYTVRAKELNAAPMYKANRDGDHRKHRQHMDESARGVGPNESQDPQNQKDHSDCFRRVQLLRFPARSEPDGHHRFCFGGIDLRGISHRSVSPLFLAERSVTRIGGNFVRSHSPTLNSGIRPPGVLVALIPWRVRPGQLRPRALPRAMAAAGLLGGLCGMLWPRGELCVGRRTNSLFSPGPRLRERGFLCASTSVRISS